MCQLVHQPVLGRRASIWGPCHICRLSQKVSLARTQITVASARQAVVMRKGLRIMRAGLGRKRQGSDGVLEPVPPKRGRVESIPLVCTCRSAACRNRFKMSHALLTHAGLTSVKPLDILCRCRRRISLPMWLAS